MSTLVARKYRHRYPLPLPTMNRPHLVENTPPLVERKPQAHPIKAMPVPLDTNPSIRNKEGPQAPSKRNPDNPNLHSPGQPPPKNSPLCPKSPPQPCKPGRGRRKRPLLLKGRNPNETNLLTKTNLKETQGRPTTLTTNAGGPFLLGADGTVALSDVGHLSGGTARRAV